MRKIMFCGLIAFMFLAQTANAQTACTVPVDLRWYLLPDAVIKSPVTGQPLQGNELTVVRAVKQRAGEIYWQEVVKDKFPDVCIEAEYARYFVFWTEVPRSNGVIVRVYPRDKSGCVIVLAAPAFETDKYSNDQEKSAKQAFKETLQFLRSKATTETYSSKLGCIPPESLENRAEQKTAQQDKAIPVPTSTVLDISSSPSGSDIELDGSFIGNTPSSVSVAAGDHTIRISRKGYKTWERKMKSSNGKVSVTAELEPETQPQ